MCASYFEKGKRDSATFDLFIRRMPSNRSYFVFAGLAQVLLFLKSVQFTNIQIDYLARLGFRRDFLDYLRNLKFTGEVCAVPEGTLVFPNEPIVRVTAPIIEAQLVETFLLNTVNLQTMLATKASRVVYAAKGRPLVEFGLRRTQGTDAGMKAARCSYAAGFIGTSNVLAGMKYDIPVFGTMAHSFVTFFNTELDAFRAFAETFPETSTLLIDTYDELRGVQNAVIIAKELEKNGHRLSGVRLDSGNLATLSKKVRTVLDDNNLDYVKIFASGDLDEYKIDELIRKGARIDAFGVGTRMVTSYDRPYVDVVYKLAGKVEKGVFIPTMKLSKGKSTLPGRKQVFRQRGRNGMYEKDIIGLEDEVIGGECLLEKVMEEGEIVADLPLLEQIRRTMRENLSKLHEKYKRLIKAAEYQVEVSPKLKRIRADLSEQLVD